jgi:hypothetical protein
MESGLVTADMVEIMEFPDLAQRYRVATVPQTVANEAVVVGGALPEGPFLDRILAAIEETKASEPGQS